MKLFAIIFAALFVSISVVAVPNNRNEPKKSTTSTMKMLRKRTATLPSKLCDELAEFAAFTKLAGVTSASSFCASKLGPVPVTTVITTATATVTSDVVVSSTTTFTTNVITITTTTTSTAPAVTLVVSTTFVAAGAKAKRNAAAIPEPDIAAPSFNAAISSACSCFLHRSTATATSTSTLTVTTIITSTAVASVAAFTTTTFTASTFTTTPTASVTATIPIPLACSQGITGSSVTFCGGGLPGADFTFTSPPGASTQAECCAICYVTLGCNTGSFTSLCELIVLTGNTRGSVDISAQCPLGTEHVTLGVGPGQEFLGPCGPLGC